jgi:hypothetical protein
MRESCYNHPAGALAIGWPLCIKPDGANETDLRDGITVGNPQMMIGVLFKGDTPSLTW